MTQTKAKKTAKQANALFVLGMHRSGTSAISRALEALGVDFGEHLIAPSEDNQRGFWEDRDLVSLNDKVLATEGLRWDSVRMTQFDSVTATHTTALRSNALTILREHFAERPLFGIKDPRICRLLPFWQSLIEELGARQKYLFIIRNPISVAQSLAQRNGFALEKSSLLWLHYVFAALEFLEQQPYCLLDYDALLQDPEPELRHAIKTLALPGNMRVVTKAVKSIEVDLGHHREDLSDVSNLSAGAALAIALYQLLLEAKEQAQKKDNISSPLFDSPKLTKTLKKMKQEFNALQSLANYVELADDIGQKAASTLR